MKMKFKLKSSIMPFNGLLNVAPHCNASRTVLFSKSSLFSTTASSSSPLSAVAAEAAASASSSVSEPPVSPSASVLEDLARSTPGSSMYNAFKYDVHSEAPYPLWWLDPEGNIYKTLIAAARSASDALHTVHDFAGMPWWATIVLAGALARTATLPLNVLSLQNASRAQDAREDIMAVRNAYLAANIALTRQQNYEASLRSAKMKGNEESDTVSSPPLARKPVSPTPPLLITRIRLLSATFRGYMSALHRANCFPLRSLMVPVIQLPWMFTAILGARHAVLLGDKSFETEGALWFTDLTTPDPYFALPAISLGLAYYSLESIFATPPTTQSTLSTDEAKPSTSLTTASPSPVTGSASLFGARLGSLLKNGVQTMIILSVPFASTLPSGLHLLMAANSAWTMTYLALVRNPTVYQYLTGRPMPGLSSTLANTTAQTSTSLITGNRGSGGGSRGSEGSNHEHSHARMPKNPLSPSITIALSSTQKNTSSALPTTNISTTDSDSTSDARAASQQTTPGQDSALFAQALPRLLYLESLITQREESSLVTVLLRTLNRTFPVLWGHANPLVLQIAGGSARAPWNLVPARTRANSRQQRGSQAIQTASTVAVSESLVQKDAAADVSVETEKTTIAGNGSAVDDVVGELSAIDKSFEVASNLAKESFRTRWLNGAAVFILNKPIHRPNRDSANSLSNANQQHSPLVFYPGDIGLLSLDAWRLYHNGRSTSAAESSQATLPSSSLPIRVNLITGANLEPSPRDVRKARTLTPRSFRFIRSEVGSLSTSTTNSTSQAPKSSKFTLIAKAASDAIDTSQRGRKGVNKKARSNPLYFFESNVNGSALIGLRLRSRFFYDARSRANFSNNYSEGEDISQSNLTASASMNLFTLSQRLLSISAKSSKNDEAVRKVKKTSSSANDQESNSIPAADQSINSSTSYETLAKALALYDTFAKHNRTRAAASAFEARSQLSRANRFSSLSTKQADAIRRSGESMWLPFTQSNQEGFATTALPLNAFDESSSENKDESSGEDAEEASSPPAKSDGSQNHGLELHEWLLEAEESFRVSPTSSTSSSSSSSSSVQRASAEHSKVKGGGK